ncbi:pre-B-cell leukemia transcription factor-interacting protein 1 isoform 2-T3 [Discoglossus pictus]
MSEVPETRDSENNWVIASTEGLPVETLGAEHSDPAPPVHEQPPDASETPQAPAADVSSTPKESKESEPPPAPAAPTTSVPHQELLEIPPEEPETTSQDLGPIFHKPSSGLASKVGRDLEEVSCSSSDDDVEGLRKRAGKGAPPVSVRPAPQIAAEQDADGGPSLTLNKCIIAALALIGLGFLLFSGSGYSNEEDPAQTVITRSVKGGEKPLQAIADIEEWMQQHAAQFTGDPGSLQVMSNLLDKVAKENQEIRHMQAKLQNQKDELESMLKISESAKISPGPQNLGLSEENVRLKEVLLKEETAHLAVKEELQNLQEKFETLEGSSLEREVLESDNTKLKEDLSLSKKQIEGFLAQKEILVAESQMLRQELDKQRLLVASIRRDLENLTAQELLSETEDEHQLQSRISEMNNRLSLELQRSETWEKKYVEHAQKRKEHDKGERVPHGHKEWKRFEKSGRDPNISKSDREFKKPAHGFKHGKDQGKRWPEEGPSESQHEEWKHKKHEHRGEKSMHWQDKKHRHWEREVGEKPAKESKEDHHMGDRTAEHRGKDSGPHHHDNRKEKHSQHHHEENGGGFHPRKGQKDFHKSQKEEKNYQRKEQGEKPNGKESHHRHHDHNKFWKKLSDHQYRIPEGCSGLEDCARKDGLDLFNVELKPVQRKQFEEVLEAYLTKIELSKHLPELVPLLNGFFEGPVFTHHKIRFRDFVDDVEDFLEDVARKETGDDDIVDDFEKYVYTNLFGEAVTSKKRLPKKEAHKKTDHEKDRGHGSPTHEAYHQKTAKEEKTWQQDKTHTGLRPHKKHFKEDAHTDDYKHSNQRDEGQYHNREYQPSNKPYLRVGELDSHHDRRSTNHKHEEKKQNDHQSSKHYGENDGKPSQYHTHMSKHNAHLSEYTLKEGHINQNKPLKHHHEKNGEPAHHHSRKSTKHSYDHGNREPNPTDVGHIHQYRHKPSKPYHANAGEVSDHQDHSSPKPYYKDENKFHHGHREPTFNDDERMSYHHNQKTYKSHYEKKEEQVQYHKNNGYKWQNKKEDGNHHYNTRNEDKHDLQGYSRERSFTPPYENEESGNKRSYRFSDLESVDDGKPHYRSSKPRHEKDVINKHHRSQNNEKHHGHAQANKYKPTDKNHWKKDGTDYRPNSKEYNNKKEGPSHQKNKEQETKNQKWQKHYDTSDDGKRVDDHHYRKKEKKHQREERDG